MAHKSYFLGLDIGTDSVGYATTDTAYNLLKFKGEPAWGVTLFDEAELKEKRRGFRTARRRLDRRQQRVLLIQELFSKEIEKIDPKFYIRMRESRLVRDDSQFNYTLFEDAGFTDKEYNLKYPTIHHLINDLMTDCTKHDVRLVYLACAWLVAHRGHFLSEISKENVAEITDFTTVWDSLTSFIDNTYDNVVWPWGTASGYQIGQLIKEKSGVTAKYKKVCILLFNSEKVPKTEAVAGFPLNTEAFLKALCGSKISASTLFCNDEYKELTSFTLGDSDEKIDEAVGALGDDGELIQKMKAVYDWSLLVDILSDAASISAAKVRTYEQHKADLRDLKYIIRKYLPNKYDEMFKSASGYAAYAMHCNTKLKPELKRIKKEDFSDELKKLLTDVKPQEKDEELLKSIIDRLVLHSFLPKQRDTDNRVIPYQLYWHELDTLLKNAQSYLPFLAEKDDKGITTAQKILSVFTYRIPYYIGPLNAHSQYAWIERKAEGRILPWNFDDMVDRDMSEQKFIRRMTNTCTYLPDKYVLPRESLMYHRFTVLNEINNLKVDGESISVTTKQALYTGLFMEKRKVTYKAIVGYLESNGFITRGQTVTGVDIAIHSDLKSYHDFKRLLTSGTLTEEQAEQIIEHITLMQDKSRLKRWLKSEFSLLPDKDIDYIARLSYKDFGRLSKEFLNSFEGIAHTTGEYTTILHAMWETNDNLMEVLSEKYSFAELIEEYRHEYYSACNLSLDKQLEEMRLSNAVKRPVLRAIEITKEVTKAFGEPPTKIFIEMARGGTPDQKNKRTVSRKQKLLDLYKSCKEEDVRELSRQLEEMGDAADTKLQSDRLYLYYTQLGRCMYSGKPIDLSLLAGSTYNIEHVWPRAYIKDDSIINNEVLVLSELNGQKSDTYPIDADIRSKMRPFWERLKNNGLISDEKFKRLTRSTGFTADEKQGFINRQLTETSQSTKAVATVLKGLYPESEIVYVKARLTTEFRQEFNLFKSRLFNDLHHAKDAYLNIVTGNVYDMRFSKRWFSVDQQYSVKTGTLFTHPVLCNGVSVWDGAPMLEKVKKTVAKNNAHLTRYAFCRKGGLFDQMPVKAADGLIPLKTGLDTAKYGGYNKPTVSFFVPVKYAAGKKKDVMIMSVELMSAEKFLSAEAFRIEYAVNRLQKILGKSVSDVSFPMGKRILKVNTMLSLDGFRVCLTGSSHAGKCIIVAPLMAYSDSLAMEKYLKRLTSLVEKTENNKKYVYDAAYDEVTTEQNIALYEQYISKLSASIFAKRPNHPHEILVAGIETFKKKNVVDQAKALINIHQVFGRIASGIDLTLIGGSAHAAATVNFSANISNWKKNYNRVQIIDTSVSGLWEQQSQNLLELL